VQANHVRVPHDYYGEDKGEEYVVGVPKVQGYSGKEICGSGGGSVGGARAAKGAGQRGVVGGGRSCKACLKKSQRASLQTCSALRRHCRKEKGCTEDYNNCMVRQPSGGKRKVPPVHWQGLYVSRAYTRGQTVR